MMLVNDIMERGKHGEHTRDQQVVGGAWGQEIASSAG